jgi:predicted O-methyltransferase YrrM
LTLRVLSHTVGNRMQLPSRVQEVVSRLDETRGLYYNLARPSAELLFVLARLMKPREIIEVGTANGYSAIVLGAAVQPFGGRVTTIERSGRLVEMARKNILDAGLQDTVTVYPGGAHKVLKRLPGTFEFVFLDGTKTEYAGYFDLLRPKLASAALLLADNMLSHRNDVAPFFDAVGNDTHFVHAIFPVGLGLLVAFYEQERMKAADRPISSIEELVATAAQRLFRGTAEDVRSGKVFERAVASRDRTMDGYDTALAEEALRLPPEG